MNPKSYETLAFQQVDDARRAAMGHHMPPDAAGRGLTMTLAGWVEAIRSARRGARRDLARPGRDLGAARRPELRQDVLHVAAGRLGSDAE